MCLLSGRAGRIGDRHFQSACEQLAQSGMVAMKRAATPVAAAVSLHQV
jgi:hypothetical protein